MVRPALLLLCLACAAVALPAFAATPSEGTVSATVPEARWTGTVTDPLGAAYFAAVQEGSAEQPCGTPAPACDTFTLTVATAAGATKLTIGARAEVAEDWVGLSVTGPDGTERVAFNESAQETIVIDAPAQGEYTVQVLASPYEPGEVAYGATATLEVPVAATPTPAPSSSPPPPAPVAPARAADQGPPPPLQAGPRELALQPDVRRVRTAVREGFRVRVLCRGGCLKVKLKVYVSSLTARTYRIGEFKGDLHVGGAPLLRDVEGRHEAHIGFRRFARTRLARAKSLTLAVEAVATDFDGRVRTTVKRLRLRG